MAAGPGSVATGPGPVASGTEEIGFWDKVESEKSHGIKKSFRINKILCVLPFLREKINPIGKGRSGSLLVDIVCTYSVLCNYLNGARNFPPANPENYLPTRNLRILVETIGVKRSMSYPDSRSKVE